MTKRANHDEQYSEREAKQRFMAALKAAVNAPPKPLKDIPKKSGESRTTNKVRTVKVRGKLRKQR